MLLPATRLYKSKSHISEFIKAKSKVVAKIGLLDKKNDKRLSIKYLLKVLDHKSECSMKFKDSLKNSSSILEPILCSALLSSLQQHL